MISKGNGAERGGAGRPRLGPHYTPYLAVLLGLFCFRVMAQPIQLAFDLPILPSFREWDSNTLPYPILLPLQLAIIALMTWVTGRIHRDWLQAKRVWRMVIRSAGIIYLAGALFRLVAGLTFLADVAWFAFPLPTVFHLVLATYVLVVGHYLSRRANTA